MYRDCTTGSDTSSAGFDDQHGEMLIAASSCSLMLKKSFQVGFQVLQDSSQAGLLQAVPGYMLFLDQQGAGTGFPSLFVFTGAHCRGAQSKAVRHCNKAHLDFSYQAF